MDKSGLDNPRTIADIPEEQWRNILPRLRLFAERLIGDRWGQSATRMLPKGYEPAELANEAIRRVLTGGRQWDPEKDLLMVLKGAVRSIASELAHSPARLELGLRQSEEDGDEVDDPIANIEDPSRRADSRIEEEQAVSKLRDWIWDELKDKEERDVFYCIDEGFGKPADISEVTGLPVDRVNQVLRNIRRRLNRSRRELEAGN